MSDEPPKIIMLDSANVPPDDVAVHFFLELLALYRPKHKRPTLTVIENKPCAAPRSTSEAAKTATTSPSTPSDVS